MQQWRSEVPLHKLSVAVTNTGPVPIFVEELQLVSDSFETVPFQRWDMPLTRTPRTDLSIPYGPARCDPDKIPPAKPATVVMRMRVGDGPSREVRFPIPADDPLLTRLVHTECASFILSEAVEVAFGPTWTRDGDRLRGVLTVKRKRATGPVTIDDLLGTTHYRLEPVSGRRHPVAVLTGDSMEIPALVSPSRCDPHAFAESKQAVLFSIQAAATEGGEVYNMLVVPSQALGLEFQAYAVDVCDLPT